MCDKLTCEKRGLPIVEECRDCWPVDGPGPEMYEVDRCSNRLT